MGFERMLLAFAQWFLSPRTFDLIVSPALADCQYEADDTRRWRNRLAVLRAMAGAARIDIASQLGLFLLLSLVPTCYYFVLITVCFDFFSGASGKQGFLAIVTPLLLLSATPVMVCFWPERHAPTGE